MGLLFCLVFYVMPSTGYNVMDNWNGWRKPAHTVGQGSLQ